MVSQLLFLLFSLGLLLPAGAQPTAIQELYVKPTEATSCPEPCHTLDEYVQNATQYFVSNTALRFLPGTHNLSQPLSVSGVYKISNLAMAGTNGSVNINCAHFCITWGYISFTEISALTLENLTLTSCDLNLVNLLPPSNLTLSLMSTQVKIKNSSIQHMIIASKLNSFQPPSILKNVTFSSLIKGIYVGGTIVFRNVMNLTFIDCKFLNNLGRGLPVIRLIDSRDISFTDCEFSNNQGTAIYAERSNYILSGSNTFRNNSAYEGGALAFYGLSHVTLTDNSNTLFMNNSADTVGGAVSVDCGSFKQCFFQGNFCGHQNTLPNLRFFNNTAGNGGHNIYGASFDTCIVGEYCSGWTYASNLFHFDPRNTSDLSAITSDPLRACLCEDGRPSCTTVFSNRTHYPGETFQLSVVVVGDRFGTVDGSVYARILPVSGRVAKLGSLEYLQHVEHLNCTNLSYTINSNSYVETLVLTASSILVQEYPSDEDISWLQSDIRQYRATGHISDQLRSSPVYVNITLLPCPLGFMLSSEPPSCICDTQLRDNHISCNITTQTVQRSGTEWVNASFHGNSSNGVIVSQYCPNDYCKPETVDVNLKHPDTQCAFNHSGILCGGCQSGLSRALGSAQCLHCSNAYLALLIPFALAGFVLVFFIKLLNLTVAQGTMNGLVFYANIVRAKQVALMPSHNQNILTVFIAWLNLDLGIETCFFDGLDAYWATWLQFIFPLYIWAIAILIIILSHYFSTAAKIFGSNSVPTLATLFLLSYPKLLRIIISVFQFSILDSEIRWSYDGNRSLFSLEHVFLFLVAMAVVLLWLPYTGVLIFAQCLQRSSNYRVGKVLNKLKPFLDAYFGPLKDKHRYWVGLLLLVRGVLFIIIAATPARDSNADLLTILVVILCGIIYLPYVGGVYKSNYLSLLENSFFLNLGVLVGGTLFVELNRKNQSALTYTSLVIAFTQFVMIVIAHCIIRLKETKWLAFKLRQIMKPANPSTLDMNNAVQHVVVNEAIEDGTGDRQFVITYSDYREPILRYLDSQT